MKMVRDCSADHWLSPHVNTMSRGGRNASKLKRGAANSMNIYWIILPPLISPGTHRQGRRWNPGCPSVALSLAFSFLPFGHFANNSIPRCSADPWVESPNHARAAPLFYPFCKGLARSHCGLVQHERLFDVLRLRYIKKATRTFMNVRTIFWTQFNILMWPAAI
ncbi:hypothetical protein BDY17DRAFT_133118 [Neohortaea acidophila]|uniref:Uncharacterized protein n=1 Tax=Neohortaea acidophila TaxID=245834 RepID=A0A6A6PX99_9PEZI|nr:uncharacterized protein BDY17DRAFT_133118 [Neohortaea acidophila]KAF2484662.1 hypothetical protein BDY17DRAFT_133118 [Neohortaea acidophila]